METTASPLSHPWTQAVQLSCVICGAQAQPDPSWTGCRTEVRLAEQRAPSAGTGAPPP